MLPRLFRPKFSITALAALWLSLASVAHAQERATIVTVNYALSYFAERLAGVEVDVVFPVPEGTDPSFWRPGVEEIGRVQAADLIVLNGAGFANWTAKASLPRSRILNTSRNFRDRYIATETVSHSHGEDGEHSHTAVASYTWLDQGQALLQANAIASVLSQRGLVDAAAVQTSMGALAQDLSALHAAAKDLSALAEGKVLIATHPRYQYFARAYGLDIRALEWDAGAPPTSQQLQDLEALKDETGASVLVWEAAPPDAARQTVQELGLADVVFPTLATKPETGDYLTSMNNVLEELSSVLKSVDG